VADDHADPLAGSDGEERFYPRGAAQKMVATIPFGKTSPQS